MKIEARDIDHLSLSVGSPDDLANKLLQLGFTLTPEGVEPRCICFQPAEDDVPNYIELVEGEPGIELAVNVAELKGETRSHSWETEDGFEIEAETVVGEADGPLPWRPVQHATPDAFMEPEWIVHPNGALGMMAVHAVSDDPQETAKALGEAWGAITEDLFDGCVMVQTGAVEIDDLVAQRLSRPNTRTSRRWRRSRSRRSSASPSPSSARGRFRRCCAPTTYRSP